MWIDMYFVHAYHIAACGCIDEILSSSGFQSIIVKLGIEDICLLPWGGVLGIVQSVLK